MEFSNSTEIVWENDALVTLNKSILGRHKRFMLVQVLIKSQILEADLPYTVQVGGCSGAFMIRSF